MTLVDALLHAAVGGLATTLPISASAHRALLKLWLGPDPALTTVTVAVSSGCTIALALTVRQRLGAACRAVLRQARQPRQLVTTDPGRDAGAAVLGGGVSIAVELLIEDTVGRAAHSLTAVGLGLMLTALALMSTVLAPSPRTLRPGTKGSLAIGLAHGLGLVPGASQIAAAFVVASWLGIRRWRAAQLAFIVAVPTLAVRAVRTGWRLDDPGVLLTVPLLLGVVLAAGAAGLAAAAWRWLCKRHGTLWLLIWLAPLAVASLTYARAVSYHVDEDRLAPQLHVPETRSAMRQPWLSPRPMP